MACRRSAGLVKKSSGEEAPERLSFFHFGFCFVVLKMEGAV